MCQKYNHRQRQQWHEKCIEDIFQSGRHKEIPAIGDGTGIQEQYLQDVHGKLKTHHYTGRSYSSRTWACSVQQDKCQSQKAVGMCPPGFGDPDNMAMARLYQLTPSFRHELASKGVAKNPGCSSHLCHRVSVLHYSGHLLYCSEDHLDCTVVWVHCGMLQDYLGGDIKH